MAGVGVLLVGAAAIAVPWYSAVRWQGSPEAVRAERNADAPTLIQATPTPASSSAAANVGVAPRPTEGARRDASRSRGDRQVAAQPTAAPPTPQAAVVAPPQLSTPIALDANIAVAPTATP